MAVSTAFWTACTCFATTYTSKMAAKTIPSIGDVVQHKIDYRRMVVIAYTYPTITTSITNRGGKAPIKDVLKDTKKPTGIQCRMKDMHNDLTTRNFIFDEVVLAKK